MYVYVVIVLNHETKLCLQKNYTQFEANYKGWLLKRLSNYIQTNMLIQLALMLNEQNWVYIKTNRTPSS